MKPRDRESVKAFAENLRQYEIEKREGKFVVVALWTENRFNPETLKRKLYHCREDASDAYETEAEAEARIQHLTRT